MSRLRRALAAWLRRTEPHPPAVARVRARLDATLVGDPTSAATTSAEPTLTRGLLRVLPEPGPPQLARARRRLDELARHPTGARPTRTRVGFALGGAVALAAAVVALVLAPSRLDVALEGGRPQDLGPLVVVTPDGRGAAVGTERAPRLTWESGRLDVSVLPGQGADVRIETPEARVRVVGTVFSVTRDRLGTAVAVDRGAVEVACIGEAPRRLIPGDMHTCLPTRPAGLLGRAQALLEAGDPDAAVIAAERGLALVDAGATRRELELARLEALVRAGRAAEALDLAEALLATEAAPVAAADLAPARTPEIRRLAAAAARVSEGCAGVRRWLDPLPEDTRDDADLVALADCEPDPVLARRLLDQAAARATDPRHAEAIRVRLDQLTRGEDR